MGFFFFCKFFYYISLFWMYVIVCFFYFIIRFIIVFVGSVFWFYVFQLNCMCFNSKFFLKSIIVIVKCCDMRVYYFLLDFGVFYEYEKFILNFSNFQLDVFVMMFWIVVQEFSEVILDFVEDCFFGKGSYGLVYKGVFKDGKEVVVKRVMYV